jgi:hypothetical protein
MSVAPAARLCALSGPAGVEEPTDRQAYPSHFTSTYDSAEALQKVLEMGVVEGASSAIDQIDTLVAA